jgi:hypothetical protein
MQAAVCPFGVSILSLNFRSNCAGIYMHLALIFLPTHIRILRSRGLLTWRRQIRRRTIGVVIDFTKAHAGNNACNECDKKWQVMRRIESDRGLREVGVVG